MSGFHLLAFLIALTVLFYDYRAETKEGPTVPQGTRLFIGLILLRVCAMLLVTYSCHHIVGWFKETGFF